MAVLLVLWDHFVGQATEWLKVAFYPAQFIKLKVFEHLAITQSGGFLGVCLFFLMILAYFLTTRTEFYAHLNGDFSNYDESAGEDKEAGI